MREPTTAQLKTLYRLCYGLTNTMLQPVHMIRMDERTFNIFVLAGRGEDIEFEIQPDGRVEP